MCVIKNEISIPTNAQFLVLLANRVLVETVLLLADYKGKGKERGKAC